jgi:hypothetical protein
MESILTQGLDSTCYLMDIGDSFLESKEAGEWIWSSSSSMALRPVFGPWSPRPSSSTLRGFSWGFETNPSFTEWRCQPHAQPPTGRTMVSLLSGPSPSTCPAWDPLPAMLCYRRHSSQNPLTMHCRTHEHQRFERTLRSLDFQSRITPGWVALIAYDIYVCSQ